MYENIITGCADLGVYVFRINLSHTSLDAVAPTIEKIRGWTDVPICLDSEGAQLRNQEMTSETVAFKEGDEVRIHFEPVVGDANNISFSPDGIARQFVVGDEISIDFDHVQRRMAAPDSGAVLAGPARLAFLGTLGAVQRHGENARQSRLADAARPTEEVGVSNPPARDRVPERLRNVLLSRYIGERAGSVLSS